MDFNEDVIRYGLHELNQVEFMIIKAVKKIEFKFIAYLLDRNKE